MDNQVNLSWKPSTGMWASGQTCFAGKWPVGHVEWVSGSKADTKHYGAFMRLPGLKERIGVFETEGEAMQKVEATVKYWLKWLQPVITTS